MSRFSIKAIHRTGLEVTFQWGCDPMQNAHDIDMLADLIIRAGFKPTPVATSAPAAPVAGEERETVSHVLRGKHVKDGKTTPTLLLYSDNPGHKHSFLKRYLDRPQDVAEFEAVSGVKLESLPVYIGKDHPKRGEDPDLDAYIVATKPFVCVYKPNSRWSESAANEARSRGEVYSTPRRVFVRWDVADGGQQPAPTTTQPVPARQATPAATKAAPTWPERMERIRAFIATRPDLETFNRKLFGVEFDVDKAPPPYHGELIDEIDKYTVGIRNWRWDPTAGQYRERGQEAQENEVPF